MSESFGEEYKKLLIENGLVNADWFEGCSDEEIAEIMEQQGVKRLPKVYRKFLLTQGKQGLDRHFYQGSDWSCADLGSLKESLISEAEAFDIDFTLPVDAFVYFSHHDYEFKYFLTDNDDDNPPVYRYLVEHGKATLIRDSLTDYYEAIVEYLVSRRDNK